VAVVGEVELQRVRKNCEDLKGLKDVGVVLFFGFKNWFQISGSKWGSNVKIQIQVQNQAQIWVQI
jgi:hypothetical protein